MQDFVHQQYHNSFDPHFSFWQHTRVKPLQALTGEVTSWVFSYLTDLQKHHHITVKQWCSHPPFHTPKWSFSVGKPMVVGYHHFRKPPKFNTYSPVNTHSNGWKIPILKRKYIDSNGGFSIAMLDYRSVAPEKWWLEDDPLKIGKITFQTLGRVLYPYPS